VVTLKTLNTLKTHVEVFYGGLAVIVILVGVAVGGLSQKPPVSRGSGMTLPPRPSPRDQLGNRHDGEAHPEREQDNA
jgi:hypothetical protein